jgi:hypothetical protein
MKIGDLAVWSKQAAQWTSECSPNVGDVAGIVIAVYNCRTVFPRRKGRVRIHDGEDAFYVSPDFVEAANENR